MDNKRKITDTAVLDAMLIPTWIFCPETLRFFYVNDAAINTYGYSREEFATMTIKDLRPKTDIQSLLDNINNNVLPAITTSRTGRWRHRRKDGREFYVELFASYIEYNDCPARMVQAIDIHEIVLEHEQTKAINEMLREQKDDLDYLFNSINEVVWIAYADNFQLLYTNPACERTHGYTPAEMIADKTIFYNSVLPEDLPQFNDSFRRMMETGSDVREFRIRHKDGSIRHLRGMTTLRKGKNGARDICCGLTIDITELKQEQHRTENILNSITDGFFVLDKQWRFTYCNHAYKKMFDNEYKEVLNKVYWDVFPVARNQKFYTEYNKALSTGEAVHFEEFATSLQKWVKVSAYPTGTGLAVYFTDINEEKNLRDALIRHDQNLYALINNTDDLIWSIDKDLNILSINRATQEYVFKLTGRWLRPGDPTATHYFPVGMKERWLKHYSHAFAGESFKALEQQETPDGEVQIWEASFYQIRDSKGNITGVSCFCANVTDTRNRMLQIELQNMRLKEIAQVQSHQVRGPVATIMGLQQLINATNPHDPINTDVLEGIQVACHTLDMMIRDIDKKTQAVYPEV